MAWSRAGWTVTALAVLLVAAFPWMGGIRFEWGRLSLSARTLGNFGGALLALAGLAWMARPSRLGPQWAAGSAAGLPENRLPWLAALAFALVSVSLKLNQHFSFQTHGGDLGIFANIAWNTLQGDGLWSSYHGASFAAIHSDLVFFWLSPVLLLWKNAAMLLIAQSLGFALSLPAVYLLVRERAASPLLGLAAILLFSGHPDLLGMSQFDFHPEPLSIPLLLWALVALEKKRPWLLTLAVGLTLSIKEDMGPIVAAWGLALLLFRRGRRGTGGLLLAAGVAAFWVHTRWIIQPHLDPGPAAHHMLARYGHLGKTTGDVALSLLNPLKAVPALLSPPGKLLAVARVTGWLLFLPWLGPVSLIPAGAALLPHLLSSYDGQYRLTGTYACSAFPFLFHALARGLERLPLAGRPRREQAALGACALAAGLGMILSPRFVSRSDPARIVSARRLVALVPPEASLRAQSDLIPHLAFRRHIQSFPFGAAENDELSSLQNPDYVALDLEGNAFPFTREALRESAKSLADGGKYELFFDENGFQLWHRKKPEAPKYLKRTKHLGHST